MNHQHATRRRNTQCYPSIFGPAVFPVVQGQRARITEDSRRLLETDAVLATASPCLVRVPLKIVMHRVLPLASSTHMTGYHGVEPGSMRRPTHNDRATLAPSTRDRALLMGNAPSTIWLSVRSRPLVIPPPLFWKQTEELDVSVGLSPGVVGHPDLSKAMVC
jgi:hypothetical protein